MIPAVYFLLFVVVWAAVSYALTVRSMGGPWSSEGPPAVAGRLRGRTRAVMVTTVAVAVVAAVLEALVPAVSDSVLDLQYLVGDRAGAAPTLVYETGGGTVSWGLYLAVFAGTLVGIGAGTLGAVRRYPVLGGLGLRSIL